MSRVINYCIIDKIIDKFYRRKNIFDEKSRNVYENDDLLLYHLM